MNLFNQALGIHEQALQVKSRRLEVLAQNIANADTPHYKARDIDFKAVLGAEQKQDTSMAATTAGCASGTRRSARSTAATSSARRT